MKQFELLSLNTLQIQNPITPRSRTSMKQVPKLHQLNASVSLSSLLPSDKSFVQFNELYELYQDFSGSQFIALLQALSKQFPEIVAINQNFKILKRNQSQFLLQFSELLQLYKNMAGQRFSDRLYKISELYPNVVPLGRNVITEKNSKNGTFMQYNQLFDFYMKKDSYQFMRKLNSLVKEYPHIVPINFNRQDIQQSEQKQNSFLQFEEISEVYDELSGNQFQNLLRDLCEQFEQMIPVGRVESQVPKKKERNSRRQSRMSTVQKVDETVSEIVVTEEIKQYTDILDMYFNLNGTKFVKRLGMLHKKYPQIVPIGWDKEEAENQHFLQYDALIDMYAQLSGAQFVELMQGLIKQYPKIVPVGTENVEEEKIQMCRFSQYGDLLELHSELSGEQFKDMLKGLAQQYPQIVSMNIKNHVSIMHKNQKISIIQFTQLQDLYKDISGPQFRDILKKLRFQYPHIAPVCENQPQGQQQYEKGAFQSPLKLRPKNPVGKQVGLKVQNIKTETKNNSVLNQKTKLIDEQKTIKKSEQLINNVKNATQISQKKPQQKSKILLNSKRTSVPQTQSSKQIFNPNNLNKTSVSSTAQLFNPYSFKRIK